MTQSALSGTTKRAVLRKAVIALCAVWILWLVTSFGIANMLAGPRPEIALGIRRHDPRAEAAYAYLLLSQKAERSNAVALARDAAQRDATIASAPLDVALAADAAGDEDRAAILYGYANSLSRREPATQVGLIEDAVRRNDVAGALNHFDTGLSTSELGWPLLIPVLAQALDDDRLVGPIAGLIARNRWWSQGAFAAMIEQADNSKNLAMLAIKLARLGFQIRPDLAQRLLDRLIQEHRLDDAAQVYVALIPVAQRTAVPRDGTFSGTVGLTPFAWQLAADGGATAERLAPDEAPENPALSVRADPADQSVILARQLLLLSPGNYRLSAKFRTSGADRLVTWQIVCADNGTSLAILVWGTAPARLWRQSTATVRVPDQNCREQWILARAAAGSQSLSGWTDDVEIKPLG